MVMPRALITLAAVVALTACTGESNTADAGDDLPVLVALKEPAETFLNNLGRSRLVLDDNGCLRFGEAFVIWPGGTQIARASDGRIQVVAGSSGATVHVGEEIGLSGGANTDTPDAFRLTRSIPDVCAGGSFFWAGLVVSQAELQALDERAANQRPVPLPVQADVADASDSLPVLVTAKEPQEAWLLNRDRGALVLDASGCLRQGDGAPFVIWPAGSEISRMPDGRIQVVDGSNGKAVYVGDQIGLSGVAHMEPPDSARLAQEIPDACSSGPFKWGGLVTTQAELEALQEQYPHRPILSPEQ